MAQSFQKHDLIGLSVVTVQGDALGHICDFEIDPTEQRIIRYHVRSGKIIPGLLRRYLLISANQVVNLTKNKMVVEDAVVREFQKTQNDQSTRKAVASVSGTT